MPRHGASKGADIARTGSLCGLVFDVAVGGTLRSPGLLVLFIVIEITAKSLDGSPDTPAQSAISMQGRVRTTSATMSNAFALICVRRTNAIPVSFSGTWYRVAEI